jgi:hypothetical protein
LAVSVAVPILTLATLRLAIGIVSVRTGIDARLMVGALALSTVGWVAVSAAVPIPTLAMLMLAIGMVSIVWPGIDARLMVAALALSTVGWVAVIAWTS